MIYIINCYLTEFKEAFSLFDKGSHVSLKQGG